MSADFWAGYLSGAVGILIGNPLDVVKVRLQASSSLSSSSSALSSARSTGISSTPLIAAAAAAPTTTTLRPSVLLLAGTAAPVLGYGALNALLFVSYNRTAALLTPAHPGPGPGSDSSLPSTSLGLAGTWLAGAVGGLAAWAVSAPTELVKCRAQLLAASSTGGGSGSGSGRASSSWHIARAVLRAEGVRGLYVGGGVTALRDAVGFGFYFWAYELGTRWWSAARWRQRWQEGKEEPPGAGDGAARALLCGGVAGVVSWASVFPLDVVKTRVQAQGLLPLQLPLPLPLSRRPDVSGDGRWDRRRRVGAVAVARKAYREQGARVFVRGLGVCSARAFVVNAAQWAVYERVMRELGGQAGQDGDHEKMI
ncbi:mitochondrial carrier domain-containing protein [Xylariaceae sp. FL0804]|nr:mitochondrial carrier domain-containing protein [Xylariaceae sp. FL0804]